MYLQTLIVIYNLIVNHLLKDISVHVNHKKTYNCSFLQKYISLPLDIVITEFPKCHLKLPFVWYVPWMPIHC